MALMGFVDPNAAAAANARAGLGNLANFLYEQQVTKPAAQAQTAGIQAQTQDTLARLPQITAQTQGLQLGNVAQGLKNVSDSYNNAFLQSGYDVDKALKVANGQTTDVPSSDNAGSSGGSPGSVSSPTLPNTLPPTQAGSSTQGAPLPGKFPPDNNDYLSPSLTQSGTQPFVTNPLRGPTTTPAPVTSPVSPVPPVTSSAAPSAPEGKWDRQKLLTTPWASLPPKVQDSILEDMRTPFITAKLPIPDAALVAHYQQQQSAYYPTAMQRISRMVPVKGNVGGFDFVNPEAATELGGDGVLPPGTYRDWLNGGKIETQPNAASLSPENVESTQANLDSNTQAQKLLDSARQALDADPSIVGPKILGQTAANLTRSGEAIAGHPANKTAEATLRRFQSGGFLTSLGGLKGVGRLDIPVVEAAKKGMPEQGDTLDTWKKYLDQAQTALTLNRNALLQEYSGQTKGGSALPPVDVSPGVSAPVAPASSEQALSPAQARTLPKGTRFLGQDNQYHIVK